MRSLAVFALLLTVALPPAVEAAPRRAAPADSYAKLREEARELRDDARRRGQRAAWTGLLKRLDRLAEEGKDREAACHARFLAGRSVADLAAATGREPDRAEAARRLRRVAEVCPRSSLVDDALVLAAELREKDEPAAARRDLKRLLERHGDGDMAARARARLAALGGKGGASSAAKAAPSVKDRAELARAASPSAARRVEVARAEAKPADPKPADPKSGDPARAPVPEAVARVLDALRPGDSLRKVELAYAEDLQKAGVAPRPAEIAAEPPRKTDEDLRKAGLDRQRVEQIRKLHDDELSLSTVAGLKVRRVVIDAGHGGHDVGAVGKGGTRESEITLAMARKLKTRLEKQGLEVLLTRDRDEFLALEDRTRFANEHRADLFISLHCNAARDRKLRGIETYTLNLNSDRYAMRLAARENAGTNRTVGELQLVLADLATKANTDDSRRLAEVVQGELVSNLRRRYGSEIRDLGTKQALFFVLLGAKMPAILVEASFLSNPDEEKRLRDPAYQEEIAASIASGVRRFIEGREAIAQGPGAMF